MVEIAEGISLIAIMPGDGNCLYSAICHQLYGFTVGSSAHKLESGKL